MIGLQPPSSSQLYVIGNGFDLYHWQKTQPNTSYNAFAAFLKKNHSDIFDILCQTCFLPHDASDKIWGDFETSLANFEAEEIYDKVRDYIDDTNPHEIGCAGWEAERYIKNLTEDMARALNEFISYGSTTSNAVQYPQSIDNLKLNLPKEALYLSFNYTDTLERFYQIPRSRICYIHGKADADSVVIIGHGLDPLVGNDETKNEREAEYKYLEQTSGQDPWEDLSEDHYSMSENLVRDEIGMYWSKSFKGAKSNIHKNSNFFNSCQGIGAVVIMGHSLSEIDIPYFEEIKRLVSTSANWHVSFYTTADKERHAITLERLGVRKEGCQHFQMESLVMPPKPTVQT